MLQPNFIEIYYDIHYFDAQNSVHQKQMYYGGFNIAEINFVTSFDQMTTKQSHDIYVNII